MKMMTEEEARRIADAIGAHVENLFALFSADLGSHDLGVALKQTREELVKALCDAGGSRE